ncbi:MAG: hypothetical protein R3B81_13765 [bacterium]
MSVRFPTPDRIANAVATVLALALIPATDLSACGIDGCGTCVESDSRFALTAEVERASFDLAGEQGDYAIYALRVETAGLGRARLAASLARATVHSDLGDVAGWRNPLFLAEVEAWRAATGRFAIGLQWEAPWGESIVADVHSEWVPYARWARGREGTGGELRVGARLSGGGTDERTGDVVAAAPRVGVPSLPGVSLHAGHAHAAPAAADFVRPHDGRELLWQVESPARHGISLAVAGEHPLEGANAGRDYLTARATWSGSPLTHFRLRPSLSGPVSGSRRADWILSVEATLR